MMILKAGIRTFQGDIPVLAQRLFSTDQIKSVSAKTLYFDPIVQTANRAPNYTLISAVSSRKKISSYKIAEVSHSEKRSRLSLFMLFLAAIGTVTIIHADDSTDEQRINAILLKSHEERSAEESIDLFNYLLEEGEKEALKAKGKDVVIIFGDTGAGKSTFVNFLYGCKMIKSNDEIIVDPKSEVPQVVEIGSEPTSCTLLPKMAAELSRPTESDAPLEGFRKKQNLTIIDLPGLSDNRGFEIELATAINMKRIVENACSVRLVMVFEAPIIKQKGDSWRAAINLLSSRFFGNNWGEKNSLSVLITKDEKNDLKKIRRDIRKYSRGLMDVSPNVTVYDPLNSNERDEKLNIIFNIKPYKCNEIKVVMKVDKLFESRLLGDNLEKSVLRDLENDNMSLALKKIKFSHSITALGNEELKKVFKSTMLGVHEYADKLILKMDQQKNDPEIRYPYLQKFKMLKDNIGQFTNFDVQTNHITSVRNKDSDGRLIAWDKSNATIVGSTVAVTSGVGTSAAVIYIGGTAATITKIAALTGSTIALANPATIAIAGGVVLVASTAFTVYAAKQWMWPSDKDKITSSYFERI